MERRTVSELKEHFQRILRISENDEKLVIIHAEETEGSKVGDNYMSVVLRSRVTGKKGNGEFYSETFMTKHYPRHRHIAAVVRNAELFQNESYIYNNVLPQLCDIAPRCVFANQDEIIMKDLQSAGYVIQPRRELLDFDHCIAVVQTLGKLHAHSLLLKFRDPVKFRQLMSPLKEAVFPEDDNPCIGQSLDSSLTTGVNHLKSLENPDKELSEATKFLEGLIGKSFALLRDLVIPDQGKYDVMTHGDAWNNNLLFKHDNEGRVTDVKLIDFQIARHVSPAIDFHYFIYSSARSHVIEENYDNLVNCYHNALINNLNKLNVNNDHIREMSLEWFNGELNKFSYYGLLTSFWLVNALLAEEEETINMDDITEDSMKKLQSRESPVKRIKALRMKCVLLHWFRRYH